VSDAGENSFVSTIESGNESVSTSSQVLLQLNLFSRCAKRSRILSTKSGEDFLGDSSKGHTALLLSMIQSVQANMSCPNQAIGERG